MEIELFDLEPPRPYRPLIPHATPLRSLGAVLGSVDSRYALGPQPEGTVRVVLQSSTYEDPAEFTPIGDYWTAPMACDVYDLPPETVERWAAAKAAFEAMEEEIEAAISARSAATRAAHLNHPATP